MRDHGFGSRASGRSAVLCAVGAAAFVALWIGAEAAAQETEVASDVSVHETLEVRVVEVDVVVLDRHGRPVLGLTADDFRLSEDGKPVEIAYFSAPPGTAPAEAKVVAGESAPTAAAAEEAPAPASGGGPTLVFLLDERLLQPAARRVALDGLSAFLEHAAGSFDRLVFARYRDRLELVEPPTPERIAQELAERGPLAMAAARSRDLTRAMEDMLTSHEACERLGQDGPLKCEPCRDNWHELLQYARVYTWAEEVRVALAIDALAELISWLGGLEGEKILLYPSEGIPHRPGIEAFAFVLDLCSPTNWSRSTGEARSYRDDAEREIGVEMLQLDESPRFRELAAWANARGVRLFPLDAAGLRESSVASIEFGRADLRPSNRFDQILNTNAQSGLFQLADETGGEAVFNSNRPLLDIDLDREITGRYSLGFVPRHPPSGRRHGLHVELVKGRGREIRYRRSYIDRTSEQRLADDLQTVLQLGFERNALGAGLSFGDIEAASGDDEAYVVPVQLTVDRDRFLRATADGAPGVLRVWLGALRDDGAATPIRQETFDIEAASVAGSDVFRFTVNMDLTAGRWTIAAGLRDETALRTSLVRGVVDVPAAPLPDDR